MSKTINFGDWPQLERLTNGEFLMILQHLSLEQYVLTQVFISKKKWLPLLDANLQTLQTKCCVCNKQVQFDDVKTHIKQNDHLMLLQSNVKQFYHPFYTYGKIDIKLARGEHTSHDLRENALRELDMQNSYLKKECIFAQQLADAVERRSPAIKEEQLIEMHLNKKIANPGKMVVLVNLPFENISKLQFCVENNEWQTAFTYKNLTRKSILHCNICSVKCCGIESLNSHLYGHAHNLRQSELWALCYADSSKVNKNCCIQFGNSFSISTKEFANNSYRNRYKVDGESWISKLPNEVLKKFELLNERAVKMFQCPESSTNQSYMKNNYESFDSFMSRDNNLGHLGVEYVLKIMKNEIDRDPKFECGLCEFFGDAENMQRHILFFDHKKKYLDLHYSDTIKKYESLIGGDMCHKELLAVMKKIVHKVASEIENHHSRSLPYTVSLADYENRRQDLITDVYSLLHASQIRGPSFSNVVSREHIRYLKNSVKQPQISSEPIEYPDYVLFTIPPKHKIYLNQISHDPVVRLREYNAKFKTNRSLRTSRSISPIREPVRNVAEICEFRSKRCHASAYHHRTRSRSPIHERSKTLLRISERDFHSPNQDIWNIYRREISLAANEIEVAYESFRKNPESHPLYEAEWNCFWQRRKKELQREGYDHRYYDFQPEWVQYFKQKIEVLFGEALHKSQIDIRHRLDIPLDAEEDCQRQAEASIQHAVHHHTRRSDIVNEEISGFEGNTRPCSPDLKSYDPQNQSLFMDQRKEKLYSDKSQMTISQINDNHSNVIRVLRLMTALEEHLGRLGGKIMDLLSKALQLEKYYSGNNNEVESRILTSDNCNLLEKAMEKLKSILFAGLLEEKKLSGCNRVIVYTENLLNYAEKMGWRQKIDLFDKKEFFSSGESRDVQNRLFDIQNSIDGEVFKQVSGKALSDTLMDVAKAMHKNKQQNFGNHSKEHLKIPVCPPPPTIQELTMNTNLFSGFKGQLPNSGLASFDTKLSSGEAHHSRTIQRQQHLPLQTDIGQLQRKIISGGNNIYNNSFKSNNETRTNNNSRRNNGSSSRFLISQIIPKMGQNNTIYQGVDGGNHNKHWLQWNEMN